MNNLTVLGQETILGKKFTIYGTKENPLFLAKSIAEMIEHNKPNEMISNVDEDEKLKALVSHSGQNREMWFLTEYGMYEVLMQSRKPISKDFKKEIKTILKEIRLNGGHISEGATVEQVEKLVVNHSMRSITKQIEECPIMELETLVSKIIEDNTTGGKKTRIDTLLQKLNATEYKQHVRKHIRKAIEDKSWSNKVSEHGVELAIRDKLIIALTDDVLATNNRKFGKLIKK